MARLLLSEDEQRRVDAAREACEGLRLNQSDIAEAIGRSRQNVCSTLNGSVWSPGTLALIETMVEAVKRLGALPVTSMEARQKDQSTVLDRGVEA